MCHGARGPEGPPTSLRVTVSFLFQAESCSVGHMDHACSSVTHRRTRGPFPPLGRGDRPLCTRVCKSPFQTPCQHSWVCPGSGISGLHTSPSPPHTPGCAGHAQGPRLCTRTAALGTWWRPRPWARAGVSLGRGGPHTPRVRKRVFKFRITSELVRCLLRRRSSPGAAAPPGGPSLFWALASPRECRAGIPPTLGPRGPFLSAECVFQRRSVSKRFKSLRVYI